VIKDPEERRRYNREWMRKRREAFFRDKVCVKCGSSKDLELDHINPSTKISHCVWSWSEPRRLAELAKCQVLCHPCHVVKSVENGDLARGNKHGLSIFTEEQVLRIRERMKDGEKQISIARSMGVTKQSINDIARGKCWQWL